MHCLPGLFQTYYHILSEDVERHAAQTRDPSQPVSTLQSLQEFLLSLLLRLAFFALVFMGRTKEECPNGERGRDAFFPLSAPPPPLSTLYSRCP